MDSSGNITQLKPGEKVPVGNFKLDEAEATALRKIPKEKRVEVLREQRRQEQVHQKRMDGARPHSVLPKTLREGRLDLDQPIVEKREHRADPRDTNAKRPPRGVRKVLRRIGEKSRRRNR